MSHLRVLICRVEDDTEEMTDHRDPDELVDHRDPDELAQALLDDPAHARAMGEAGRRFVTEHFNTERFEQYVSDFLAWSAQVAERTRR